MSERDALLDDFIMEEGGDNSDYESTTTNSRSFVNNHNHQVRVRARTGAIAMQPLSPTESTDDDLITDIGRTSTNSHHGLNQGNFWHTN